MSIIAETLPVDWQIDPRDDGSFVLRKYDNGRWSIEATLERYDGAWYWSCDDVVQHLGECDREDAMDYLWSNRGRSPWSEHHPFCDCDECTKEQL